MKTTRSISLVVLLFVLVAAACGKENKVGDESLLNFKDQAQKERLGETTTTVAAASTTAPPTTAAGNKGALRNTTTTAAAAAATTTTAVDAFDIAINSDQGGSQFAPPAAQVYVNTIVRWTNKDSVARSVQADDGSFRSPSIAPGASWTYRPTKTGRFNYHDGTRPYAVASLEVIPR